MNRRAFLATLCGAGLTALAERARLAESHVGIAEARGEHIAITLAARLDEPGLDWWVLA